jgi:hypothetical protein
MEREKELPEGLGVTSLQESFLQTLEITKGYKEDMQKLKEGIDAYLKEKKDE